MNTDIDLKDLDKVNLKLSYLNLLQNIINRMSTFSIAMKTASVTTLTALLAYSASETVGNNFKVWMFLMPWIFFTGYNAYFLRLERAFRTLYNNSANHKDISFDDFRIDKNKLNTIYEKWSEIIFSKPLLIFHLSLLCLVVISFAKIKGISCI